MILPLKETESEDIRVLILDDDPLDAELLEDELQQSGVAFDVKIVSDQIAYIKSLHEFRPDIILSDYDLRGFTGSDALEISKRLIPAVPFILVTGAIGEERAVEVLTGGATDYILKQNLAKLLPAIRRALHEAEERRRRREAEAERDVLLKDLENLVRKRTEALRSEIAERERAETMLQESEKKYRLLFNSLIEGFCLIQVVFDEGGHPVDYRFVEVNPMFEKMTGLHNAEGKSVRELLPDNEERWYEIYGRVARTGEPVHLVDKVSALNRWYDVHAVRFGEAAGAKVAICFSDVTERRQADEDRRILEERLQRAEKMEALGLLAGGIAHDLNNVLGVLVGYSDLILSGVEEDSPIHRHAGNILKAGERAASIVQDMLTLARRGVQNKKTISINRTVTEYLRSPDFPRVTSFYPDVRIRTELEEDLLRILGSPVHMTKTLMNLVLNAAEAMPQGGEVVIRTRNAYLDLPLSGYDKVTPGDYVVLSVSDEGEGISGEDLKHIFEPFYTKKVMGRSGTGLGLAVVWGTVRDHHGYIDVESEKGKGTTLRLYFPVTREPAEEEEAPVPDAMYLGSGEKILVVDDVAEQRELAADILAKLNYSVETVESGERAVDYLREREVDLVVLDMIMEPGIDGLETYRRIIEIRPQQKAVIVSGYAETESVKIAQGLGAGEYVRKPYIRERIGLAIRRELEREKGAADPYMPFCAPGSEK